MRAALELAVLLYCLWPGEGGGQGQLHSPRELQGEAVTQERTLQEEGQRPGPLGARAEREGAPRLVRSRSRSRRGDDSLCGLRSLLLRVRELGLGYDSEETVLFRYCGGGCPRERSNHDLTLSALLQRGALPPPPPGTHMHSAPCCRPTRHEDLAFLDSAHRWHRVEKLSAAACSCVG
ncbi:persephin [Lepisosteus oculatus]|uniref:Artemin n=1 Tax=Lepisosteus oculatus TaxID=7918 RepID=W5MH19_LEPOC|nr:PREDICTED: persephin [Lepisosteus oculatus]